MSDWQPGDLALCVRSGSFWHNGQLHDGGASLLRTGQIYLVDDVIMAGVHKALILSDAQSFHATGAFHHLRFRKIRPHTPDAEDAETIALLTGKPAFVPEPQP